MVLAAGGAGGGRVGHPPTPERGGRRKKYYRAAPLGIRALQQTLRAVQRMASGIEGL